MKTEIVLEFEFKEKDATFDKITTDQRLWVKNNPWALLIHTCSMSWKYIAKGWISPEENIGHKEQVPSSLIPRKTATRK